MAKKKKKAPAAQNLIDSLLDEKSNLATSLPDDPDELPSISLKLEKTSAPKEGATRVVNTGDYDKTVRLEDYVAKKRGLPDEATTALPAKAYDTTVDRNMPTEVKTAARPPMESSVSSAAPSYARPSMASQPIGSGFSNAEANLKQSESLRIAQVRILELEHEIERLRRENEKLATAGETLRRRADELLSKAENSELQMRESQRIFEEEKKVFRGQLQSKDRENLEMRGRLEEAEVRLESNFKKIRVRERELEHRLEIVKMESATLVSTKDKMILDLKRQIDQLAHENDYGKQKAQELFGQFKDKQETIRRVVRALRIALTILEGDEDGSSHKKGE